jgi:hypothetical protein
MKLAVKRVTSVSEEFAHYGERHLDTLIDACSACMNVVSTLWLELCDFVHAKFAQGKWSTQPVLTLLGLCMFFL